MHSVVQSVVIPGTGQPLSLSPPLLSLFAR